MYMLSIYIYIYGAFIYMYYIIVVNAYIHIHIFLLRQFANGFALFIHTLLWLCGAYVRYCIRTVLHPRQCPSLRPPTPEARPLHGQ